MPPAFEATMPAPAQADLRGAPRSSTLSVQQLRERFSWVVEEHYRQIYHLVYHFVGDAEAAADLTQDVFVKAYQGLPGFRQDSTLYTWLYRIALNTSTNWLKRQKVRRQSSCGSLDDTDNPDLPPLRDRIASKSLTPPELLELQEFRQQVWQCLRKLPDHHRAVIVMRDIEDLSYEDIARVLGVNGATVKSRLFRARQDLKKILERKLAR